jgi:Concanavalin A-like lectin/glucanases superfamily
MRLRTMIVLMTTAVAMAAAAPVAHADVAAHWRLDEGMGSVAHDSSGNANDGALSGATQWIAGKRVGALQLDGGHVAVQSSASLQPQAVTAAAWIKRLGSPGNFKYILAKGASGCLASSFALYSGPGGGLAFYVFDGSSFALSPDAGTSVWDGTWHYVAGTYDGAAVRLYVDGVQVGTGTPHSAPIGYGLVTSDDLLIGDYGGCGGLELTGAVDEPKIWDRALTAAEIVTAMQYEFRGFFAPVENPSVMNVAKAGSAIPVKFSLTGFQGLDVIPAGGSSSQKVECTATSLLDLLEETASPGASSLSYDATTDRYQYVWKTDKSWSGTCRKLSLRLDDGSVHTALFKFTR